METKTGFYYQFQNRDNISYTDISGNFVPTYPRVVLIPKSIYSYNIVGVLDKKNIIITKAFIESQPIFA